MAILCWNTELKQHSLLNHRKVGLYLWRQLQGFGATEMKSGYKLLKPTADLFCSFLSMSALDVWARQWQNLLVLMRLKCHCQMDRSYTTWCSNTSWNGEWGGMLCMQLSSPGRDNSAHGFPHAELWSGPSAFPHCLFPSYVKLGFVFICCHNQGAWKAIHCLSSVSFPLLKKRSCLISRFLPKPVIGIWSDLGFSLHAL